MLLCLYSCRTSLFPPLVAIGFGAGKMTPPPMHCARCVGIPLTIHQRRRNCTDGSVLLLRRYVLELPTLSHNASQTRRMAAVSSKPRGCLRTLRVRLSPNLPSETLSRFFGASTFRPRGKSSAPLLSSNSRISVRPIFQCLDSLAERHELYQNRRAGIKRGGLRSTI